MKRNGMNFATLAAAAILCTGAATYAQDPGSSMAADKNFVMHADSGNTAEISASEIALKKSKNPDIKAYAQEMITDHQKMRMDMAPAATKLSVMTPQPLSPTHKVEDQRLSQLSGKKFDDEYIKDMVMDHQKTLGMFNNEIATTADPDLKMTVQQGATVVQQHLDMATQLATKMNVQLPPSPPPTSQSE